MMILHIFLAGLNYLGQIGEEFGETNKSLNKLHTIMKQSFTDMLQYWGKVKDVKVVFSTQDSHQREFVKSEISMPTNLSISDDNSSVSNFEIN